MSDLGVLTDPWQPALLALIARTASAGLEAGKPIRVCGGAAADPLLACVLAGLGVRSPSAAATAVPTVGSALARVTLEAFHSLASGLPCP